MSWQWYLFTVVCGSAPEDACGVTTQTGIYENDTATVTCNSSLCTGGGSYICNASGDWQVVDYTKCTGKTWPVVS